MTIKEMQMSVYQNKVEKGFNITDISKEFCLLYGEVSEAYDAWKIGRASCRERVLSHV